MTLETWAIARFTVTMALAIHFFVVFPLLVRFVGGMSPLQFFKRAEPAILTAFSTSSSSATRSPPACTRSASTGRCP